MLSPERQSARMSKLYSYGNMVVKGLTCRLHWCSYQISDCCKQTAKLRDFGHIFWNAELPGNGNRSEKMPLLHMLHVTYLESVKNLQKPYDVKNRLISMLLCVEMWNNWYTIIVTLSDAISMQPTTLTIEYQTKSQRMSLKMASTECRLSTIN